MPCRAPCPTEPAAPAFVGWVPALLRPLVAGTLAGCVFSLLPLWLAWAVAVGLVVVTASALERWGGR